MPHRLPPGFLERLKKVIPQGRYTCVLESFSAPKKNIVRVNTLRAGKEEVLRTLREKNIAFEEVPGIAEALILEGLSAQEFEEIRLEKEGVLYRQGISSQMAVVVLDPQPDELILDMCAAPGSKATQIAARMDNQGELVCLERVRGRYYKLKNVVGLMGAANTSCHLMDARRFRAGGRLFDKILVDAPCSSEGRFQADEPKTYAYWSLRKIKEMARKQRGLLFSASRLLRPEGTLVYSTCTFAPEENEGVINWLLKKTGDSLELEDIFLEGVERYPAITGWEGKGFNPNVQRCFRVLPKEDTEGFFIAKLKKKQ